MLLPYLVALLASTTPQTQNLAPQPIIQVVEVAQAEEIPVIATSTSIEGMISFYAEKYEVSSTTMYKTLKCESGFRTDAIGDHGQSYGAAQFYLPAKNKTVDGEVITKEMAINPEIAVSTMAYYFSEGFAKKWTCFRNLGLPAKGG